LRLADQASVSAIFSALIVHAERSHLHDEDLSAKIRPYLLALKQFEQVFVLARWVRNLFMDMTNRRQKAKRQSPHESVSSYDATEFVTGGYVMPSNSSLFGDPFNSTDLGQFLGDFLPNFNSDEYFSSRSSSTGETHGYPVPGSVGYQTLHFLTDLGMPNT
jgi:hypothetical protein